MLNEQNAKNLHLAVLIDADNTSADIIEPLLKEIAKFGTANVRRIYGDWTDSRLNKWKETLLNHSINPVQQFAYTTGKNATDIAMIIDAMDLLYTNRFDGFCIVSSDSDFTPLATRIREQAITVYGFGKKTTPKPFIESCDKFIHLELLEEKPSSAEPPKNPTGNKRLITYIKTAIEAVSDDNGWANLGPIGSNLNKQNPAFDPREYGHTKLSNLMKSLNYLEVKSSTGNNVKIRIKPTPTKKAK